MLLLLISVEEIDQHSSWQWQLKVQLSPLQCNSRRLYQHQNLMKPGSSVISFKSNENPGISLASILKNLHVLLCVFTSTARSDMGPSRRSLPWLPLSFLKAGANNDTILKLCCRYINDCANGKKKKQIR